MKAEMEGVCPELPIKLKADVGGRCKLGRSVENMVWVYEIHSTTKFIF